MDRVFKEWAKALDDFKSHVDAELNEIRRYKAEVQMMREEIINEMGAGRFLRDDTRLILSAPEIIIGNVDKSGELSDTGDCTVVIRGHKVNVEGAGQSGDIRIRAPRITQVAVDPGSDGQEDVVGPVSEIISQAKSIAIDANDDAGIFVNPPVVAGAGGVSIHADNNLIVESNKQCDTKKGKIEARKNELTQLKNTLTSNIDQLNTTFRNLISTAEEQLTQHDDIVDKELKVRTDIKDLLQLNDEFKTSLLNISATFREYSKALSALAEVNRKIKSLDSIKSTIPDDNTYKTKSNGSKISLQSETVSLFSVDGEGNPREDLGAGLFLSANSISLASINKDASLLENSSIDLQSKNVMISTVNSKNETFDNSGKQTGGEYPAEGSVTIHSKNVEMKSTDQEFKNDDITEKSLTKDGKLTVRFEKMDFNTNDTDGKATGKININSKKLKLRAMDLDKDSRKADAVAKDSNVMILAENMFIGDKEKESNRIQLHSKEVAVFAKDFIGMQQGDRNSGILLEKSAFYAGGDTINLLAGNTKVYSKIDVAEGEVTVPKATINSLDVKSTFKSPNISDGMAAVTSSVTKSLTEYKEELIYDEDNADADDGTRD